MPNSTAKPKPPRRLAQVAAEHASVEDLDTFLAAPTDGYELAADTRVRTLLAMALLHDVMKRSDLERIRKRAGLAVVVSVPGPDWVEPVASALRRAGEWSEILKRNGASRLQDKADVGCENVADELGAGLNVAGVSNAPERYLPANLVALADIRVDLGTPSPRALRSTIRLVTKSHPGPIPKGMAAGLPFATLAACIRRGSSGAACVRRIRAASLALTAPGLGLADVQRVEECHGYGDEVMRWSMGLVAAMAEFRAGKRTWSSIEDRNIVLAGDAGVGKTSFARSLAKSLGVPLHATSVSAWFACTGGYLNEIVKQVDTVLGQAVAAGPAVLLLDEVDSIPNRATIDNRNRDYWVPIVSHILTALDSAVSGVNSSLIVIGTTNFPERLDPALTRPGRLNRIVRIPRPDTQAVGGILRHHLRGDLRDVDLGPIAAIGTGATGAEIAGWARQAREAARSAGRQMTRADLVAQVAPPETRNPEEVLAVARHEAAHCVIGHELSVSAVETVSIVAVGPYAGQTRSRLPHNRMCLSRQHLDDFVVMMLAGRAADAQWGCLTNGSAGARGSDLATATRLVAAMHASYGLGEGIAWLGSEDEAMDLCRKEPAFRRRVEADLNSLQARAAALVGENSEVIDAIAGRLVRQRVMSGDEVRRIIASFAQDGSRLPAEEGHA